ncbi:phosphoribosylanthranilate isomerase [Companilactobacillus futsaii]|uniref:phosphoribosylanthranilate isomerase n=1 Tax=Companilactobacillus futsaii TaxID=938155 RepID=UPI0018A0F7FA|nr:phosphoribosylanthranilate isomerase [Companilactobacillus futsaii]
MTKIKICGLMTPKDIEAVNSAKPDLAGFIFAPGRHQINLSQAMVLRKKLNKEIPSVGVFVDAPLEEMHKVIKSKAVSMIQLHGSESETVIEKLQQQNIPVIKVFKPDQIRKTQADYVMLDSGKGDGKRVQWQDYQNDFSQPLIIAGNLNFKNITSAVKAIKPQFVDLSRGVETDNQKDPQKINEIVKLVHQL